MVKKIPAQEETRQQGYIAFPSSMYFADSDRMPKGRTFEAKLHWHEAIEILHFKEGRFEMNINMEPFEISEECFCIVESGMLHSITAEGTFHESALLFHPSILSARNMDAAENGLIAPLMSHDLSLPQKISKETAVFDSFRKTYNMIEEIFRTEEDRRGDQYNVSRPDSQLAAKSLMMLLIAELSRNHMLGTKNTSRDPKAEALKSVITYIQKHYSEKIYIGELAKLMNFNEQYFSRFFKKTVGKTPVEYINEVRIREAARLLANTSESVLEIAEQCGFGNVGHFIDIFKRYTGYKPLEYRNMRRKQEMQ